MTSNHYTYIPPASNLPPSVTNVPKLESVIPQWPPNHSDEFENREKYMETELTEESHYLTHDNSANQNEYPDDEQGPPPGLRRLVTGQPVSFDDGPSSPPFDRVIPGEGSTFTNYVGQPPSSSGNVTVSDRFVSGSTRKEFNPVPQHIFGPIVPPKQESHQFFNNNNNSHSHSNANAFNAFNVSSEDFFDSYLRNNNKSAERVNYPQQPLRNKPVQLFNASSSPQQYATMPRISTKSSTSMQTLQNHQPRPQSVKSDNCSRGHPENFLERTSDNSFNPVNTVNDFLATSNVDIGSGANFQPSENNSFSLENIGMQENEEKWPRNDNSVMMDVVGKKTSNRMVVEGSSNHVSQSKMLSSSTPVHSPSYDHWYQNNDNEFTAHSSDVTNVHGYERAQNTQPLQSTSFTAHDTFKNSKSSNASSANEIASYQQNENRVSFEKFPKYEEDSCSREGNVPKFFGQGSACQDKIETKERLAETARAQVFKRNEELCHGSYESANKMSDKNSNPLANLHKNINTVDKGTDKSRENLITGNDEHSCTSRLSRDPVPGAQSVPGDGPKVLSSSSSMNVPLEYTYQRTNKLDNDAVDERVTDVDENQAVDQRTVSGHHCNTIPTPKLHTDLSVQANYSKPPLETRMVVGETSSDIPLKLPNSRSYKDEIDDIDRDRDYAKNEERNYRTVRIVNRNEKARKKPHQGRSKNESDEEFTESLAQGDDVEPERESRSYRKKHQRDGLPRYKKCLPRLDCESSITHDDSFDEDEDDDCDVYRRYENRKHPRGRMYMPYYADPMERDWNYYDRPSWDRYPEDVFQKNSRPSSRSGSEMRREPMERGFKPPFYNSKGGSHPSAASSEFHHFWTKMRPSERKVYAEWYRTMYPQKYTEWYYECYMKQRAYQGDRRGSGHSGRSSINNDSISANEEKLKDLTLSERSDELGRESFTHEHPSSPFKFQIPHVRGLFNSLGQLLIIKESYPKEGQSADINVYEVSPPDDDPDVVEFMNFTGPFIVGETHVNTVAEFVRYRAACASTSSEKLLYSFIELLIKLRGVTDGIAISELLISTYRESQKSNMFSSKNDLLNLKADSGVMASPNESEIVEKYTNLLLQGDKNTALDLAINHKLWGHAFLLASKMGNKYYRSVLAKFDASIATNNPLKTFYQLYSNQIPQAATACADEKWGDWRPHLAMILSNPTSDGEIDKSAIVTLGDSLYSKDIFAAHFCYLAAEANFDSSTKHSAKLSLLSLRNGVDYFGVNTSNHAILLTQIYEFAKRLQQKDFTISALLPYKYLLAVRLIDFGKCDIALQYLESVATGLGRNLEDSADMDLAINVVELADRIKYSDSKPLVTDQSTDPPWLTSLRELLVSSGTQCKSLENHNTQTDSQKSQLYQQSQLPMSFTNQQQQLELQQEQSSIATPYPSIFSPSPELAPQQPLMIPHNPPQTVPLVPPLHEDQSTWMMNSQMMNNFQPSFTGAEKYQNIQKLGNESSIGDVGDLNTIQAHIQRSNSVSNPQNDSYSPWDQPSRPAQISMHSTKNSFYDDNSSNSVIETKKKSKTTMMTKTTATITNTNTNITLTATVTSTIPTPVSTSAASATSVAVNKTNHALRKQVQANVANKQHISIVKRYLNRRRTSEYLWLDREFWSVGNNNLGQMTRNTSHFNSLSKAKIVFNGTYPIDKPLSIRRNFNTGQKVPSSTPNRTEEAARDSSQIATNKELDKNSKDKKSEKESSSWFSTFGSFIRPKNQMKLPDDKDKPIYWDEDRKRWIDKNSENDDTTTTIKPPPKASDLPTFSGNGVNNLSSSYPDPTATSMSGAETARAEISNPAFCVPDRNSPNMPPHVSSSNIYKLQKGRGMKANYVDVLSQNTKPPSIVPQRSNFNPLVDSSMVASVPPKVFMPSSDLGK